MRLNIDAYFFNAQTDYLPYYKPYTIEIGGDKSIKEILPLIKEQNFNFSYPETEVYFRVNGLVVSGEKAVSEVVDRVGSTLKLDPISDYRATNGLIINDDDFMRSYDLLAPYASQDDLEYYKSLYPLHYASETFSYNNQYIGDAILLLAHKMIEDKNEHKDAILQAVSDHYDGLWECEYDNNLFDAEDHTDKIAQLKDMATGAPNKYKPLFVRKYKESDVSDISGRTVAFYAGSDPISQDIVGSTLEQIRSKGGAPVRFSKECKRAGQTMLKTNPRSAYLKMGMMLLDAMDSGAEILVAHNEEETELFKKSVGLCEKVVQRDIKLEFISRGKLMGIAGSTA